MEGKGNIEHHPKTCLLLWSDRTILALWLSTYCVPGPMFGAFLFWFILSIRMKQETGNSIMPVSHIRKLRSR